MMPVSVIAIFDIGKTNKKFFLLNEQYKIVWERSKRIDEIADEDGDHCDDIQAITEWAKAIFAEANQLTQFYIIALNFSAYGASFVHIGEDEKPVTPLYNYLKHYPEELKQQFHHTYGKPEEFSVVTTSPVLGHLNSGMQLYWLKQQRNTLFSAIRMSLHLPQYMSYLFTGKMYSDITSIGCHTALWDFQKKTYHDWVSKESIVFKLPIIFPGNRTIEIEHGDKKIQCGIGLHDSSAALIPYLAVFQEPFVLISTGTWCISLNPFNESPLTADELRHDCLCYLSYEGKPVKASRLFAGYFHEEQAKRLADYFQVSEDHYKNIVFDASLIRYPEENFAAADLLHFGSYAEAYHALMYDILQQQYRSTLLVLDANTKRLFVDGGFAVNTIYMHLLARIFPQVEVFAASVSQATAIGAALAIHAQWNKQPVPSDMVSLRYYAG